MKIMKTFEEDLKDNLSFISEFEDLIDSHLIDFITKNLWQQLPQNLRINLDKFADEFNYLEIIKHCPELNEIVQRIESLGLKNNPKVLGFNDVPRVLLNNNSEWREDDCRNESNDFMNDKKRYEISVLSKVVGCLAGENRCLVIDAGGGKGYLASYLSEKYSIPVLSVDSNPCRHKSALDRQELMKKKKHRSFSLVKHSVKFIDERTNYPELVKSNFPDWKHDNYLLTGLHTCGPLAHAMMKSFVDSETLKILCVVSCCYHLTDEFLTTEMNLTKNMRMLAQQSVERISANNGVHPPSIFYRALLQVLLEALGIPDARIGRGAPTDNFIIYARWALKKLQLGPEKIPSDEDLMTLQKTYANYQWKINIFQSLRAHMGSVIESSIILDRFIYLQQSKKCKNLSIIRLFDPLLSPRCYAIIAFK